MSFLRPVKGKKKGGNSYDLVTKRRGGRVRLISLMRFSFYGKRDGQLKGRGGEEEKGKY